jgi:TPR repeat protein
MKLNYKYIFFLSIVVVLFALAPFYLFYDDSFNDPQKNYEFYLKNKPGEKRSFNELIRNIERGNKIYENTVGYISGYWKRLKAIRCLKKAAEQGLPEAQCALAIEYYKDHSSQNNIKKGNKWLLKAADNGNLEALRELGYISMSEKRVFRLFFPLDYKKALECFQKVADKGDLNCQLQVAYLYSVGKGADKDIKKAEDIYRKAAAKAPAYSYNGIAYMWAEEGVKLDEAEKLAKKALELKPEDVCIIDTLGWIYFKQKKYKKAKEELLKASKLRSIPAVLDHLGDVQLALGEKMEARESWRNALSNCEDSGLIKSISSKMNNLNKSGVK